MTQRPNDATRAEVLTALGWFFDGPYLDHVDALDDVALIVALWKADRQGQSI